jgi:Pyruvate/2-oxoacid:ferredoxin oxidoreductase delta subunit
MTQAVYKSLAERLDALPNGFPPTEDGAELRLLEYLFTPEEAEMALQLRLTPESPKQIAERVGGEQAEVRAMLKGMAKKGLIKLAPMEKGFGFALLPFVVGIYEFQMARIDAKMAQLFENYYQQAFNQVLKTAPQVHRVIPVYETVKAGMEVQPYESASAILDQMQSWGVVDCICRKQKALIGDPCDHPVDVCMTFSERPGAFEHSSTVRSLTKDEAMDVLQTAADAGLVHSVSNNQEGLWYICNCCTCSCGILRGMAELGISNVIAHSAFINTVDADVCSGCETCLEYCQFDALSIEDGVAVVHDSRCVGCGVCVPACDTEALLLVRRPDEEVLPVPVTEHDWGVIRAKERGIDMME